MANDELNDIDTLPHGMNAGEFLMGFPRVRRAAAEALEQLDESLKELAYADQMAADALEKILDRSAEVPDEELGYDLRDQPLSRERQKQLLEEGAGRVDVVIRVHLSELIDHDVKGVLDLMSQRAVGHTLLMENRYKVVGRGDNNELHVNVSGYVPEDMVREVEDVPVA